MTLIQIGSSVKVGAYTFRIIAFDDNTYTFMGDSGIQHQVAYGWHG